MTDSHNDTIRPSVLAIGGVTAAAFGDPRALRVRYGIDTRWEWRPVTEAEYQIMLDALNGYSPGNAVTAEVIARTIATELGEAFEVLPPGPHFDPEFTQDDFMRAGIAVLALFPSG